MPIAMKNQSFQYRKLIFIVYPHKNLREYSIDAITKEKSEGKKLPVQLKSCVKGISLLKVVSYFNLKVKKKMVELKREYNLKKTGQLFSLRY